MFDSQDVLAQEYVRIIVENTPVVSQEVTDEEIDALWSDVFKLANEIE